MDFCVGTPAHRTCFLSRFLQSWDGARPLWIARAVPHGPRSCLGLVALSERPVVMPCDGELPPYCAAKGLMLAFSSPVPSTQGAMRGFRVESLEVGERRRARPAVRAPEVEDHHLPRSTASETGSPAPWMGVTRNRGAELPTSAGSLDPTSDAAPWTSRRRILRRGRCRPAPRPGRHPGDGNPRMNGEREGRSHVSHAREARAVLKAPHGRGRQSRRKCGSHDTSAQPAVRLRQRGQRHPDSAKPR